MIKRDELVKIGQFNRPHGLKGELAFTFTNDIFDRTDCKYIICPINGIFVPFFMEEYRFRTDSTALMKLVDVDSSEEAKMFTNVDIYFPKRYLKEEQKMQVGRDFFLNFKVIDKNEGELGHIVEVEDSTANVLFVIDKGDGEQLLIPAVDEFVVKMDEKKKIIYMDVPPGLFTL